MYSLKPGVVEKDGMDVDIERPVLINPPGRASLFLELRGGESMVDLDIPLHARYLAPSELGHEAVILEKPVSAGWGCPPFGMAQPSINRKQG